MKKIWKSKGTIIGLAAVCVLIVGTCLIVRMKKDGGSFDPSRPPDEAVSEWEEADSPNQEETEPDSSTGWQGGILIVPVQLGTQFQRLSLLRFQNGCCLVQLWRRSFFSPGLRLSGALPGRDRSPNFFSAASSRETFFVYSFSRSSKISNHCSRMVTVSLWARESSICILGILRS